LSSRKIFIFSIPRAITCCKKPGASNLGWRVGRNGGRGQLANLREEHKALTKPISLSHFLVLSRCKDLLVHKNQLFLEVCP